MDDIILNKINEIIDINNRLNLINEKVKNKCFTNYEIKNLNNSIFIRPIYNNENNNNLCPILECCICYSNNKYKLNCNHSVCNECFVKWYKECLNNYKKITCPVCRSSIT
jgi:hypothetical protein